MITHVKLVTIPTSDQDRALDFYTAKLGFKLVTDQPFDGKQRWIELRIGSSDTRFVLFTSPGGIQPGSRFQGSLACDDVEKTFEQLSRQGVEFLQAPRKEPWGTYAIMKDPDDNQFVLSSR